MSSKCRREFDSGQRRIFRTFDEAAGFAVALSASDGRRSVVNVLVWSRAGARFYAGDDGVEMYDQDPEASVFERIAIRAYNLGRIA